VVVSQSGLPVLFHSGIVRSVLYWLSTLRNRSGHELSHSVGFVGPSRRIAGLVSALLIASSAPAYSRGFGWFFTHSKPHGSCTGQSIVATYYSSGRRTASGQAFDSGAYTAAHRTLPFGSSVTVMNPDSGRSVTVVINDRGPFTRGVTLDLSRGAARAIGMSGTQWVCMN
jgi:rare lipoprotein A